MVDSLVYRIAMRMATHAVLTVSSVIVSRSVLAQVPRLAERTSESSLVESRRVTVNADNAPLTAILETIAVQSGLTAAYNKAIVPSDIRVTLHVHQVPMRIVLEQALRGTGLVATVRPEGNIYVTRATSALALGMITGKVIDGQTKQPLRSAKIELDGVDRMETAADGAYRLVNVGAGTHTMTVKLLGYRKVVREILVPESGVVVVDAMLERSATPLDQVVVTGTVIPTELKAVPNAMTVITAKQIESRGITRIDQLFRGDMPGLFSVSLGAGDRQGAVSMYARGVTKLGTGAGSGEVFAGTANAIKTYIDGIELANPSYLSQLDPKSIERIEILTGPQASTIYGSNAINGVMQIFTKRGMATRPQLTVSLLTGVIQNDFTSKLTPQHDNTVQVDGVEGHASYHIGGGWSHVGRWTPSIRRESLSGFGGLQLQYGLLTADISVRRSTSRNTGQGDNNQVAAVGGGSGAFLRTASNNPFFQDNDVNGQTMGFTLGYAVTPWWSHEAVVGVDILNTGQRYPRPNFTTPSDTALYLFDGSTQRSSVRYSTTVQLPMSSVAQLHVTAGADGWRTIANTIFTTPTALTGSLNGSIQVTRMPDHNSGVFVQGQLGLYEAIFLTYGLRAEWNPNFGDQAQPNLVPRYGVAYAHDWGPVTAKLRASYGRATRPPARSLKNGTPVTFPINIQVFGPYDSPIANLDLGPEDQRGGEGGLEMYWADRGSLIITRYNQTVNNLITEVSGADSVRSLLPDPLGLVTALGSCTAIGLGGGSGPYCYILQTQNLNVGAIRNQGWELQETLNIGPWAMQGTYSWTKSRMIGITPKYRTLFSVQNYPLYQPGATFNFLPEHTWAFGVTYLHSTTSVSVNLNGTAEIFNDGTRLDPLATAVLRPRLLPDRPRVDIPRAYRPLMAGYVMADLNATHRISSHVEAILQVKNLTNTYHNDFEATVASIGRQSAVGMRIRL